MPMASGCSLPPTAVRPHWPTSGYRSRRWTEAAKGPTAGRPIDARGHPARFAPRDPRGVAPQTPRRLDAGRPAWRWGEGSGPGRQGEAYRPVVVAVHGLTPPAGSPGAHPHAPVVAREALLHSFTPAAHPASSQRARRDYFVSPRGT